MKYLHEHISEVMAATIGDTTAYHPHLKIHIDQTINCLGIIYHEALDYVDILIYQGKLYLTSQTVDLLA